MKAEINFIVNLTGLLGEQENSNCPNTLSSTVMSWKIQQCIKLMLPWYFQAFSLLSLQCLWATYSNIASTICQHLKETVVTAFPFPYNKVIFIHKSLPLCKYMVIGQLIV